MHWCTGALVHWCIGYLDHVDISSPRKKGGAPRACSLRRGVDLIFIFDIILNFLLVYQENAGPEGTQRAIG